jgi:hypothetical protein
VRVAALVPELLFASRVKALLEQAGHEVALVGDPAGIGEADVVVADVMDVDPVAVVASGRPALGIFNHTAPDVRDRALAAGFAKVVPRSRFVRDAAELISMIAPPPHP